MTYQEIIKSSDVVLVEFYASWCPHCQHMMSIVAQVKELLEGRAQVVQLDIDNNSRAASVYNVESVPTFIIYKDGVERWRHTGELDAEVLLNNVQSHL
ncbi:MAG: thioredoxin family protein [Muribaculaceae bacterium]|nr:thioredoxin family protein [Muribaculaceae bacterium]